MLLEEFPHLLGREDVPVHTPDLIGHGRKNIAPRPGVSAVLEGPEDYLRPFPPRSISEFFGPFHRSPRWGLGAPIECRPGFDDLRDGFEHSDERLFFLGLTASIRPH